MTNLIEVVKNVLLGGTTIIEDPDTVEEDYCDGDLTTLELAARLRSLDIHDTEETK